MHDGGITGLHIDMHPCMCGMNLIESAYDVHACQVITEVHIVTVVYA